MPPRFPIFSRLERRRTRGDPTWSPDCGAGRCRALFRTGGSSTSRAGHPLSFVLTPPLLFLRRLKVPRVVGVSIVVTFAFVVIVSLGWLLSQQVTQLAENLPAYRSAIVEKIGALRTSMGSLPAFEKASEAVKDLERELAEPDPNELARRHRRDREPQASRSLSRFMNLLRRISRSSKPSRGSF